MQRSNLYLLILCFFASFNPIHGQWNHGMAQMDLVSNLNDLPYDLNTLHADSKARYGLRYRQALTNFDQNPRSIMAMARGHWKQKSGFGLLGGVSLVQDRVGALSNHSVHLQLGTEINVQKWLFVGMLRIGFNDYSFSSQSLNFTDHEPEDFARADNSRHAHLGISANGAYTLSESSKILAGLAVNRSFENGNALNFYQSDYLRGYLGYTHQWNIVEWQSEINYISAMHYDPFAMFKNTIVLFDFFGLSYGIGNEQGQLYEFDIRPELFGNRWIFQFGMSRFPNNSLQGIQSQQLSLLAIL